MVSAELRPGTDQVPVVTTASTFTVPATRESVPAIRRRACSFAAAAGMDGAGVADLALCVTEAAANAVVHAYRRAGGTVEVELELDTDVGELLVVVRDRGRGVSAQSDEPGTGYGLFLMRTLPLRTTIASAPCAGTEVRMTFALGRAAPDE